MLISPGKPAEEHPVLFLQLVPDLSSEDVFRPMLKVLHIQQKQLNRAGSESHCWCFIEAAAAQKTHYLLFWQDSPSSCSEIKMLEYQTSGVFWFEDCGVVFHCCVSYMIHITLTFSSWWHLSKNLFVFYCRSTEKEPLPYKTQVLSCSSSKTPLTWQSACRHHVSLCFHVLSV